VGAFRIAKALLAQDPNVLNCTLPRIAETRANNLIRLLGVALDVHVIGQFGTPSSARNRVSTMFVSGK
jgi:hypothetical protein